MRPGYWPDEYLEKRRSAAEAIKLLSPGQRVFIGTSCGEPQALVRALAERCRHVSDLEIVRLLSLESLPLSLLAAETDAQSFTVRSFYLGSARPKRLAQNKRFIVPINLSSIPRLFHTRRLAIHAALIQVSPPDDFGWMSLGISVDVTMAAAQAADVVIVQVNPRMPRVLGRSFIHVNEVDVVVEHEEDLLAVEQLRETERANLIGYHVAKIIEDGSTIQMSLGAAPKAILNSLSDKNDLGVHTQFLSEGIMHLVSKGTITNRKKEINQGKCVASGAIGSANLYEFINDNPGISFFPSDYVNNPSIIAQHSRMVSVNVALAMDLTGQAAIDALPTNHFTGVSGTMDFIRGSRLAERGKSILMIPSTTEDGSESRIVPNLEDAPVVVPRGDIHYVATEYGVVNLFGKTLEERAMAMISISHPDFRDFLLDRARESGLVGSSRTLDESLHGVYPIRLEEAREIQGERVLFRPARATDGRLIQEHFYSLRQQDVISRFLQERHRFAKSDVSGMYEVDYIKNLTIVAVTGEVGFERVIAVGGYYLEPDTNLAEVAYSVANDWQQRGLSSIIQSKLVDAARENGIQGMVAYVSPDNKSMIKLFKKLPYKVRTSIDKDMIILKARFDEPE